MNKTYIHNIKPKTVFVMYSKSTYKLKYVTIHQQELEIRELEVHVSFLDRTDLRVPLNPVQADRIRASDFGVLWMSFIKRHSFSYLVHWNVTYYSLKLVLFCFLTDINNKIAVFETMEFVKKFWICEKYPFFEYEEIFLRAVAKLLFYLFIIKKFCNISATILCHILNSFLILFLNSSDRMYYIV